MNKAGSRAKKIKVHFKIGYGEAEELVLTEINRTMSWYCFIHLQANSQVHNVNSKYSIVILYPIEHLHSYFDFFLAHLGCFYHINSKIYSRTVCFFFSSPLCMEMHQWCTTPLTKLLFTSEEQVKWPHHLHPPFLTPRKRANSKCARLVIQPWVQCRSSEEQEGSQTARDGTI